MEDKEKLLDQCKSLIEAIKENELTLGSNVRSLQRQADNALEKDRKIFKQDYDNRLQKVQYFSLAPVISYFVQLLCSFYQLR
jgi:hypothetical protein